MESMAHGLFACFRPDSLLCSDCSPGVSPLCSSVSLGPLFCLVRKQLGRMSAQVLHLPKLISAIYEGRPVLASILFQTVCPSERSGIQKRNRVLDQVVYQLLHCFQESGTLMRSRFSIIARLVSWRLAGDARDPQLGIPNSSPILSRVSPEPD
jgi:hypothetical protein